MKAHEAQILDRSWFIYSILTDAFSLTETFHLDFPSLVETTIISADLQISLPISKGLTLLLREEYEFVKHSLEIRSYCYNVIDDKDTSVLRADNLPYHRTDYKRHKLTHFPHHLHDKQGRICSFTGDLKDFIETIKLTSTI